MPQSYPHATYTYKGNSCQRSPYGNIGVYYCDAYCLVTQCSYSVAGVPSDDGRESRSRMFAARHACMPMFRVRVAAHVWSLSACLLVVHGLAIMLPPHYVAVHRGNEWLQPRVQHVAETMRWVLGT